MKSKKNRQKGGAIGLFLFIICVNLHPIILNPVELQASSNNENDRTFKETVATSAYSPDFTGNGDNCNVSLQQSLIDSSPITISNTSDPLNNTFYEPCPTIENFPSSFVNMTVEDIYAPNKTLIIEDEEHDNGDFDFTNAVPATASFKVKSNCYLNNISVHLSHNDPGTENATVRFLLYNSTWDTVNNRSIPGGDVEGYIKDMGTAQFDEFSVWVNFTCSSKVVLNNSKTENNTWFIGLIDINPQHASWDITEDTGVAGDRSDDSDCYTWLAFPPPGEWIPAKSVLNRTIDFPLKVGLAPYISSQNQMLIIEDGINNGLENLSGNPEATSFRITDNGYLENISVYLRNTVTYSATIRIDLFNSEWNRTESKSQPVGGPLGFQLGLFTIEASSEGWMGITSIHEYLNISNTENNTWFIAVFKSGVGAPSWMFTRDDVNGDNSESYFYNTTSHKWQLREDGFGRTRDYHLKVDLSFIDNLPSKIGLKINDVSITGDAKKYGTGFWISTDEFSDPSGYIEFTILSDWWDVSCIVTSVQIDYTKTDVRANSSFIVESEQEVLWHVTDTEGLNYLDPRITDTATINLTIPTGWNNINVFNGTINKTDNIILRTLDTGYREVCLLNAGSGDWFLTASSVNFLASIDSYRNSSPETQFNYSDIVHFNITFQETIFQNDGLINLSIYNPALINDVLNFTFMKAIFDSGQEFAIGDWDVSNTVTQYGVFRVQASWHNETAVGFMENTLTINGESNLILIEPPQNAVFDSVQQFTIIVYYEDAHLHKAIDGAAISFNIANQGWKLTTVNNGTTGFYLIPVDCSELSSSGSKRVEITATREFYSTPTLEYIFEIRESTSTTTTTTTTTQPDTSTSTTATTTITTTTVTETGNFPNGLIVLAVLGSFVIFIRRRKKI